MSFLQPEILFGLPLLLVPILIHLLNRRRYRIEDWGAMQFLIQATRASTSRAKLKQILILMMRTLAVLMLIFFLSRPLAGGWVGQLGGGKPDTVFMVIDRSASMELGGGSELKSLREQAIQTFEKAFELYQKDSNLVWVDTVSSEVIPVDSFDTMKNEWLSEVTDTTTSFPLVMMQIYDWIQKNSVGISEVWIASDLQVSNWQLDDSIWEEISKKFEDLPQKVSLKVLAMDGTKSANVGVISNSLIDSGFGFSDEIPIRVSFIQNSIDDKTIPVEIRADEATYQSEVELAGERTIWRQTVSVSGEKTVPWINVSLPDDGNIHDNNYYFIVPPEIQPKVIIVSEEQEIGSIIQAAVSVGIPKDSPIYLKTSLDEAPEADTSIIIWQGALPQADTAGYLVDFVESGGSLLFLPSTDERVVTREIFDTRWNEIQLAEESQYFAINNWDQQSGPVAKTAEGFSLPLDKNNFLKRRILQSSGSSIVQFTDEMSFLLQTRNGKGRTYWMSSLPITDWSTLGQGFSFVPILQRILVEASGRFVAPVQIEAGRFFLDDENVSLSDWRPVFPQIIGMNPQLQSGVYKNGERLIAVNPPTEEFGTNFYNGGDLKPLLGAMDLTVVNAETKPTGNDQDNNELQSELWKIFLLSMIVFLGLESFFTLPPSQTSVSNERIGA